MITPEMKPAWPAMSLADAHARLTAPGAVFELETLTLDGRPVRVWKNGPKSLHDLFYVSAAFGARTFLVYEAERISYDAFARAALAFARALTDAGVERGDRVAIAMRNLPEWIVAFFGAALAGAIAAPLNAWWSAGELLYALDDSGAAVAVFDPERFERVRTQVPACARLRRVFLCRGEAPKSETEDGVTSLESLIGPPDAWAELPPVGPPPRAVAPDDEATLFYTSGTTGNAKGVPASHRAAVTPILAGQLSVARAYLRRGETPPARDPNVQKSAILCIPLFHVTGCFSALFGRMASGDKVVMMRRFEPEAAMALVEQERASMIGGVPTVAAQILEHPARRKYDLSSLELVAYGGAPAASELVRRINMDWPHAQAGCGWGMTETCATFTHHLGEDYTHRPDSCGPATPVGDMKVVDAEGRALPPGEVGELWVYGPHVAARYWNKPEATAATMLDGWLRTGDLARIDVEGFCYIVDRLKDVIIRGGENIYSSEVEDVLYAHPAVMEAALVAIPHPTLGEEPGAVVTLRPGLQADEAELKAHVRARLAAFKTPVRVIVRREPLPRNPNGKILKSELKRLFEAPDPKAEP